MFVRFDPRCERRSRLNLAVQRADICTACACFGLLPPMLGMLEGTSTRPSLTAAPFWVATEPGGAVLFTAAAAADGRAVLAFCS